jgi:glycerol kinase
MLGSVSLPGICDMLYSNSLYLAIDQGGQSSRVAVYDNQGQQLACFSAPLETRHYTDAAGAPCVEQDPHQLLRGLRDCLAQVESHLGQAANQLVAAGFAGQGSSLLCWHRQTGEPLSPILSWQDRRAGSYLQDLPFAQSELMSRTGLRLSPHYGASKLRWCLDNLPEVQAASREGQLCMGPIAGFVFQHLTGAAPAIDPGHAQRTLLWNLHSNSWDAKLLSAFGIQSAWLPECRWHKSHFGELRFGGRSIPLTISQRDQGASLFAGGLPQADAAYVNIGTGAFVQCLSQNLLAPEGLLVSPLWLTDSGGQDPLGKTYAWEAPVNGAAAALPWLAEETGGEVTPERIHAALNLEPFDKCFLLNGQGGLSAPWWRPEFETRFGGKLSADEKILAWLESLIFQVAVNLARIERRIPVKRLYLSGGLSRAEGLCQRLANITGKPVIRRHNPDATLQGLAWALAGMPEDWSGQDGDTFKPVGQVALLQRFAAWQSAMAQALGTDTQDIY